MNIYFIYKETFKEKITESLNDNKPNFHYKELYSLVFLAKNKQDIDLVLNATKL